MPLSSGKHRDTIPLIKFLSDIGDGTGVTDGIGDYSSIPLTLFIQPPEDEVWIIHELIAHVVDAGKFGQSIYGSLASGLAVGVAIKVTNDTDTLLDITNGHPIKTNSEFMHFSDMYLQDFGGVADSLRASFKADLFGIELALDGSQNHKLEVTLNDNFQGLIDHHFIIHGFR